MRVSVGKVVVLSLILSVSVGVYIAPQSVLAAGITHAVDAEHGLHYVEFFKRQAEIFKERTGIDVNMVTVSNHREQITVWAAGGVLPDVVDIVSDIGVRYLRKNLFLDLRPLLEGDVDLGVNRFIPIALAAFTVPNDYDVQPKSIFAVPCGMHTFIAGVNLDRLELIGLESPNALGRSWGWSAAEEYARKLTLDTDGDGHTDKFGMHWSTGINRWGVLFRQAGQSIYNRDFDPDRVMLDTREAYDALGFMARMIQMGYVTTTGNMRFYEGTAAITYNAETQLQSRMIDAKGNFAYEYAPFPYGPSGTNGTEFQVQGMAISATSVNVDLAWKWLKFLWGSQDNAFAYGKSTGFLPVQQALIARYPREINPTRQSNLLLAVSASPGSGLRPMLRATAVNSVIQEWVLKAWNGQASIKEALMQAQRLASAALETSRFE